MLTGPVQRPSLLALVCSPQIRLAKKAKSARGGFVEYISVEAARQEAGLRLVCTRGIPGPWGEAAKAAFRLRGVEFVAVAQEGGEDNEALVEWTRHRNAPIALYNDEPPRVRAMEIIELAQRLGSGPDLLPRDARQRMLAVGLINELAGEDGFGWHCRLLMLQPAYQKHGESLLSTPMYKNYYSTKAAARSLSRIRQVLDLVLEQIIEQEQNHSPYLVGDRLTSADIHWAYFSQLLDAYPAKQNPMPDFLRTAWGTVAKSLENYDEKLIAHRDRIFENHLELPIDL